MSKTIFFQMYTVTNAKGEKAETHFFVQAEDGKAGEQKVKKYLEQHNITGVLRSSSTATIQRPEGYKSLIR